MKQTAYRIYLVDAEDDAREEMCRVLTKEELLVEPYASTEDFLSALHAEPSGCLVSDINTPEMGGLALQAELARRGASLPIIFVSAHANVATAVRAIKAGAVDFLIKPIDSEELVTCVRAALNHHCDALGRLAKLTEREREILNLAIAGHPNKDIARQLGISHRTVETHRSHILQKTGTGNLLELARLIELWSLPS